MTATAKELRELVVACYDAAAKRDLTETEMRVVWLVLRSSFGNGRHETGRLTLTDLAVVLGISKGKASEALKKLRGKRIVQMNSAGDGLQFIPETGRELADGTWQPGHQWLVPDRLVDVSRRILANRVEAAQRRVAGEMQLPGMEEPDLDAVLGEVAVEQAAGGNRENGEGARGTRGGAKNFFPAGVPESGMPSPSAPLKSSTLYREPFTSKYLLNRETVPESGTSNQGGGVDGGKALCGIGGLIPEDPNDYSEPVLMKRLHALLGKGVMKFKGGQLRLFIRGSLEAEDDPATAIAMMKAINETVVAQREGKIRRSVFGFLRGIAFQNAGNAGWKFDTATLRWVRVQSFNNWQLRNSLKQSIAEAAAAATT